ncbi:hypothetical protein HU200_050492 [Digitaria exilis]|uniref:Uncharacterized protein n=1 Tax=Digitaria exilis TaxID=1010633 RepID=A0A835ATG3_9POAL|nr:hypothetical protein HU200_050492 [Digitaria exilis]
MAAALQAQRLFLTPSTSTSSSSSTFTARRRSAAAPCRAAVRVPNGLQATASPADLSLNLNWIDAHLSPSSSPSQQQQHQDVHRRRGGGGGGRSSVWWRRRRRTGRRCTTSSGASVTTGTTSSSTPPTPSPSPPPPMAALAATMPPLKASAGVLLATAAVTMAAVNTIQPSQLAEEQRNATRLWRQLERHLRASLLAAGNITDADVQDAMDRVPALDAAYPLPLLPGMLEKFPKSVEPPGGGLAAGPPPAEEHQEIQELRPPRRRHQRQWMDAGAGGGDARAPPRAARKGRAPIPHGRQASPHPQQGPRRGRPHPRRHGGGGVGVHRQRRRGPPPHGGRRGAAVVCGAAAAAANTVEHGGQMGMVFELLRNCAGVLSQVAGGHRGVLGEVDVERRENGEVFETKVALLLGRSSSELKQLGGWRRRRSRMRTSRTTPASSSDQRLHP